MFKVIKKLQPLPLVAVLICIAGQSFLELWLPDLMSDVTMQISGGTVAKMLGYGGIALAAAFGIMILAVTVSYLASKMSAKLGLRLRNEIFGKIQTFSLPELDQFGASSLITRTTNDITQLTNVMTMLMRIIISAPIMLVGGIFMAIKKSGSLTIVIALAVPLLAALIISLAIYAIPKFKSMQRKIDRLTQVTRERLIGVRVIRAFDNDEDAEAKFDKASKDVTDTSIKINRAMAIMMPSVMLIFQAMILTIYFVGHLEADSVGYAANMAAVIQYAMRIMMSFMMMAMMFIMLPRASVSAARINAVLATEPAVQDTGTKTEIVGSDIVFQDVSFRYGSAEDYCLRSLNFAAAAGQTTAIIGGTGSGKTTILNLIERFYDVSEGSVTVGGEDVRSLKLSALRDQIGYVPQTAVLFNGTISENLRFGRDDTGDGELNRAVTIAQAAQFISEKPEGMESSVSQGGTNFSGGQKQRLSIARAIVRNPKIYIFDDAFSALDFKTDAKLRQELKTITKDSTVLIVAQRISTIMNADKIIVLENGAICGQGTHEELMQSCPEYISIAENQLKEGA